MDKTRQNARNFEEILFFEALYKTKTLTNTKTNITANKIIANIIVIGLKGMYAFGNYNVTRHKSNYTI